MISDDRLNKALSYLSTTDEEAAKAKALMEGLKNQEKTILAAAFLEQDGTVAEKDARSRISPSYTQWRKTYEDSVYSYETLKNKRNTEAMIVEVWRTMSANQRRGNI